MTGLQSIVASVSTEDRATYWRAYLAAGGSAKSAAVALGMEDSRLIRAFAATYRWDKELEAIRDESIQAVRAIVAENAPKMEIAQRAVGLQSAATEQDIGKRLKAALADPKADAKDIAALAHAKTEQGRLAIDGVKAWAETWGVTKATPSVAVTVDARTQVIEISMKKLEAPEVQAEILEVLREAGADDEDDPD